MARSDLLAGTSALALDPQTEPSVPERPRRTRLSALHLDREAIASRVVDFAAADRAGMQDMLDRHLQRYAKYRMWTEGKDWPWPDSSDLGLPDMMETVQRGIDALGNAVMIQRPPMSARAVANSDSAKEEKVEKLIDHQVFIEQPGEETIADMADLFHTQPCLIAHVRWVRERRKVKETREIEPVPDGVDALKWFQAQAMATLEGDAQVLPVDQHGLDWIGETDNGEVRIAFYDTPDGGLEMDVSREVTSFEGPLIVPLERSRVLTPPRAANLQAPSPANPGGAAHVIMVDYPTIDEITRLHRDGYYDLCTDEDMAALRAHSGSPASDLTEEQKDILAGQESRPGLTKAKSHDRLTRLVCYDLYDIDGDGINEDVIFWVIEETRTVCKVAHLSEMYPMSPPRRPFVSKAFIQVPGRLDGISALELMEGTHDASKAIFDMAIDSGAISNIPFFAYRASSAMKPETIRIEPGIGIPLGDPSRDINVPQIGNVNAQAFQLNILAMLQSHSERLTMANDYKFGQVPSGSSSALRTIGGMQMLAGQSEARPERILRRFFGLLAEIWSMVHELNRRFLPEDKKIRIIGYNEPGKDPYLEIGGKAGIDGQMQFEFRANVLNTTKSAMQQSLQALMATYLNPLALQLGIINAETAYRLLRDFGRSLGQDVDSYLTPPTPQAARPRILAEEAVASIMSNLMPDGWAAEAGGMAEHLQRLMEFAMSDEFGHLLPNQVQMFGEYLKIAYQRAQEEQQQQQMAQMMAQMQQGGGQAMPGQQGNPGAGRPPQMPPMPTGQQPQLSGGGELLDESLPTAGGGANAEMA